jgi:HK97 gp10 family phage protein
MINNTKEVIEMMNNKIEVNLTRAGMFVQAEAKKRTPVDLGNLRRSINYEVNMKEKEVIIGTNVDYALKMEKGGSKQAPNGYLQPAMEENLPRLREILGSDK